MIYGSRIARIVFFRRTLDHYFHDRFWECFISRLPGIFASVQRRAEIRYDTASADVSLRRIALAANIVRWKTYYKVVRLKGHVNFALFPLFNLLVKSPSRKSYILNTYIADFVLHHREEPTRTTLLVPRKKNIRQITTVNRIT